MMPRHSSNTYATETPITDGKRVYAYFGMMGVYCYDLDGQLIWKKDLGSYPMRAGWGTAVHRFCLTKNYFYKSTMISSRSSWHWTLRRGTKSGSRPRREIAIQFPHRLAKQQTQ